MNLTTKKMCFVALMTALTCVIAPFSVPIFLSPVPITFTNLVLYISIGILGYKLGTISYLLYLLLGLVGLPVFSSFGSGIGKLVGPTGGYLIGFIFLTFIGGLIMEKMEYKFFFILSGMIVGTIFVYLFGSLWLSYSSLWLSYSAHISFSKALALGVLPYILFDCIKIAVASSLIVLIRRRLSFMIVNPQQ